MTIKTHGCTANHTAILTHLVWLLLVAWAFTSQASTIKISQLDFTDFNSAEYLDYIILEDSLLTDQQILALTPEQFRSKSGAGFSPSLAATTLYRLRFYNDTDKTQRLIAEVSNPMIDRIEFLLIVDGTVASRATLGDLTESPNALQNSLPHFDFVLPRQAQGQLYLQVESKGSTVVPLTLHNEQTFRHKIYQTFVTWGGFIGILLMMTAYNLLLYFGIRNKIYLFYLGYILAILVQLGVVYGFGFHLFPYPLQRVLNIKLVSINYVISIFAILFALYFLHYEKLHTRFFVGCRWFCAILAVIGCITLFLPEYVAAKIYYPLQLVVSLIIIRICLPNLFDGQRWSTFYLLSWLPLFAGTTIAQLLLLDLVSYNYFTQNALLYGVVFEIGFISIALAERFRANELERLYNVTHDSVTRLPNGILLTECIARQMGQQCNFTLIVFRADKFKEIKPALGIIAANNLVNAIVKSVTDYFCAMKNLYVFENESSSDIRLAQINDDTFGLVLLGSYDGDELKYLALTIQEAVSTPINVGGYNVSTSCSVGSVSYPQFGSNAEMLIQKAVHSLDLATKEDSKFAFYSSDSNDDVQAQLQLIADLQEAIDKDLLAIYHQPQIALKSQTVCGNEALLRWQHPTRGFISPDIFIPLAENSGLISQLTEWVITRSLEQHAQILEAGFRQNISINLSAKDLTQTGLIAHIMTTIHDLSVDPDTIIFELTESATSENPVHALQTINQLHELKVKVAIDDFGTGYSSMEYLSRLPFHELKVDKSFVLNILQSRRDQTITKTTIEMAKNLGIFVVAEGIETSSVEALLKAYGCELGQGYLYSKPIPLTQYLTWLETSPYSKNDN